MGTPFPAESHCSSGHRAEPTPAPNTKTPSPKRPPRGFTWAIWTTGLGSLLWFLVRVIPKPSRAAYPCQRAAAPAASAFVIWLCAVLGAKWALVRRRELLRRARLLGAGVATGFLLLCVALAVRSLPESPGRTANPPHGPVGVAKGIFPGRVVWVHAPDATSWPLWTNTPPAQPWWQSNYTDLAVVEDMMAKAIRDVAGADDNAVAWRRIFEYYNGTHNRGRRGYQTGEKIAIKINLTTCNGGSDCNLATHEKTGNLFRIDNSPQMLLALFRQLVYVAGVPQESISIGDPTALFPGFLYNPLHGEFPNVNYFEVMGGVGRTQAAFSSVPFYWSTPDADGKVQDYVPVPFAQADYFINFAILKGHSAGVTLCGKNLYGALKRCPSGSLYGQGTPNYYVTHLSLPNAEWSPGLGHYRSIVDLLGHPSLGGKTLLCLIDGLYAGYYWDSQPSPWSLPPFGNGTNVAWPSSLFVSQDPVAIDSVAYDFLLAEWPSVVNNGVGSTDSLQGGAEDYLHEAAQANNPPSGSFYDPSKSGTRLASLGVHEHWNNPIDKQYSRNLGQTNGIELVYSKLSKLPPSLTLRATNRALTVSWPASQTGFTLQRTTNFTPPLVWNSVTEAPFLFQAQNVVSNDLTDNGRLYRLIK